MFTDQPVTPARLETIIEIVRGMGDRKVTELVLEHLVQPRCLPGLTPNSHQGRQAVSAAKALGLFVADDDGGVRLNIQPRDRRSVREILLEALDGKVLGNLDLEPHAALFYAYLIGRAGDAKAGQGQFWEAEFERDVFDGEPPANRFNNTKYTGLRRWLRYMGLGWHDGDDTFHPSPYDRIRRCLPVIFGVRADTKRLKSPLQLDSIIFMQRLAETCPELDGGWIFVRANTARSQDAERRCTLALAHALIDLHLDQVIQLHCPADSAGWSLDLAQPPRDQEHLLSDRFDSVQWPGKMYFQERHNAD
jgi:hypothetical protein